MSPAGASSPSAAPSGGAAPSAASSAGAAAVYKYNNSICTTSILTVEQIEIKSQNNGIFCKLRKFFNYLISSFFSCNKFKVSINIRIFMNDKFCVFANNRNGDILEVHHKNTALNEYVMIRIFLL